MIPEHMLYPAIEGRKVEHITTGKVFTVDIVVYDGQEPELIVKPKIKYFSNSIPASEFRLVCECGSVIIVDSSRCAKCIDIDMENAR